MYDCEIIQLNVKWPETVHSKYCIEYGKWSQLGDPFILKGITIRLLWAVLQVTKQLHSIFIHRIFASMLWNTLISIDLRKGLQFLSWWRKYGESIDMSCNLLLVSFLQVIMPPTTPYAGKFNSYSNNNNHPHPQPHSPYRNGTGPKPAKENVYNSAYSSTENPYDIPQRHSSYRSSSVSSSTTKEHHYNSTYAVSENPYSSPQPHSPRQHSTSCPGRAYRHTSGSSGGSSEQSCRNNSITAKGRIYPHGVTASYGEMCYHDNSLVSASLEALIQHLVPTVDYYPDVSTSELLEMFSLYWLLLFSCFSESCSVSSSSEVVCVHLPAEFTPLPAPVRAHDEGLSPVCRAAAVRRCPAG